ncbi:uncharacterized protein LOC132759716 [Ruditapes philippinarum]|uniref:uncharacterized protein LOC132759716 n=1 Tax=Ruditapes philippinarum TaxID=129788 RepID=UPI00295AF579|nr:uncharacterized protein LOC132759716 [Ruditapes philippinarum]
MTGRTSADYEHVLKAIKRGLRNQQEVEEVVCDFEKAIWKAMRRVFPTVLMKGCSFHWGQAVWRHIQGLGLSTEYMNNHGTYSLLRMIFCLPFLPAEHIIEVFDKMEDFNTSEHLEPLFQYLRRTWFESSTWTVENWSVFGQSVRTNNDCEGKFNIAMYNDTMYINFSKIVNVIDI